MQQTHPHNTINRVQTQHILSQPVRVKSTPPARKIALRLNRINNILTLAILDSETNHRHTLALISNRLAVNLKHLRLRVEMIDQNPLQLLLMRGDLLPRRFLQVRTNVGDRSRELVVRRCHSKLVLQAIRRFEEVAQRAQGFLRGARSVQRGDVRAVQLVPRERVEIDAQVLHIDGAVGGIRHGVDAEQGAGDAVHGGGDGLDIADGAEDVGSVGASDEFRLLAQQALERFGIEVRVLLVIGGAFPPDQFGAAPFGQLDPAGDVGFVVELGDDDFGVGGDVVVQAETEVAEELGCRRAQDDFGGGGVDVFGYSGGACFEETGGFAGDFVGGAELDVVGGEVV